MRKNRTRWENHKWLILAGAYYGGRAKIGKNNDDKR